MLACATVLPAKLDPGAMAMTVRNSHDAMAPPPPSPVPFSDGASLNMTIKSFHTLSCCTCLCTTASADSFAMDACQVLC